MSDPIRRLNEALEGRYRIERELGEGGMATVYLADDLRHKRSVALKVLKPELAAVVGAERFLAEIQTTANLQHPHILPLFDSGEADGYLFYVMPYVEGETLADRLDRERQLPVEEAVAITVAIAGALEAAHEGGVVHRDIKPANILLSRGQPLVSDFGIALAVSQGGGGRLTETGLSLGTPYYMSPEQATGDRAVGPTSDVYSLGCVLFEMLVGDPPFVGSTAQAVLGKIIQGDVPSATAARATVPLNVDAAIHKSLAKLPADRFRSAGELAKALEDPSFRDVTGPHVAAMPSPAGRTLWTRLGPLSAAAALVFAAIGAWGWLRPVDGTPTVRVPMDLSGLALGFGEGVIISPDGRRLVVAAEVDGERALWTRNIDEADFRRVAGTEDAGDPAFSPDGDWVVYSDRSGGQLEKVYLLGGAPTVISTPGEWQGFGRPHWAEDDSITVMGWRQGQFERTLLRVAASGGGARVIGDVDRTLTGPQALPGSRFVLGWDRRRETSILLDIESSVVRTLREQARDPTYVEALGRLLWVDPAGTLWAAPFDPRRGEITGTEETLLVDLTPGVGGGSYSVSSSGTLVYRTGGNVRSRPLFRSRLLFMGMDGSVTVDSLSPRPMWAPVASPDGRYVAYGGRPFGAGSDELESIFLYDASLGGTPRAIATDSTNFLSSPQWSPDGRRIVLTNVGDPSQSDVLVYDVGASAPPTRVATLSGRRTVTEWNRRGVFLTGPADAIELRLGGEDGLDSVEVRTLFEEPGTVRVRLDPRGEWLVYQANEMGAFGVYLRRAPDFLVRERVAESTEFLNPWWAPDGNSLLLSNVGDDGVYAVQVDLTPVLSIGTPRRLFDGPNGWLAFRPDGRGFVGTRYVRVEDGEDVDAEVEAPTIRYLLVVGWFDEIRRRAGG